MQINCTRLTTNTIQISDEARLWSQPGHKLGGLLASTNGTALLRQDTIVFGAGLQGVAVRY